MHSATDRFVPAMAMLNFGGPQTGSTSVQNFVRTTLRKRCFVSSIPPYLQVLGPPIQPNRRLLRAKRTELAGRITGRSGNMFWPALGAPHQSIFPRLMTGVLPPRSRGRRQCHGDPHDRSKPAQGAKARLTAQSRGRQPDRQVSKRSHGQGVETRRAN